MEQYKPGYMGKVMPADDPVKMTDFVENKYDAFNNVYDVCKSLSDKIEDIKMIDNPSPDLSNSISVKVSTDTHTIAAIQENCTDPNITISDYVITAKG